MHAQETADSIPCAVAAKPEALCQPPATHKCHHLQDVGVGPARQAADPGCLAHIKVEWCLSPCLSQSCMAGWQCLDFSCRPQAV